MGAQEAKANSLSIGDLAKQLGTDLKSGLSQKDASERLKSYGPNVVPKVKQSFYRIYIAPLLNWLIDIYLITSTILAVFALMVPRLWDQVAQWVGVIALNALVVIAQQARARRQLGALEKLSAPKSKVVREGVLTEMSSEQVVPGDVIKLQQGDRIPADGRIISLSDLRVNEATLTGESMEVEKSVDGELSKAQTYAKSNMVFLGTHVTRGTALVLVTKTGRDTELGKISGRLEELGNPKIRIQEEINRIAEYLAVAVVAYLGISLVYNALLLTFRSELFARPVNMLLYAEIAVRSLITAMSVMPINIPLLTSIVLLTGVLVMAGHQVVVRDLNSIETFNSVSIVCSDKTGTITKGEMTVRWMCQPGRDSVWTLYGVTGVGFQSKGEIRTVGKGKTLEEVVRTEPQVLSQNKVKTIESDSTLEYLLVCGFLDNDSSLIEERVESSRKINEEREVSVIRKYSGNLTDIAISILFSKSELDKDNYRTRFQEVRSFAFDSKLKRMSKVFRDSKTGEIVVFSKGATEVILPLCKRIARERVADTVELDEQDRNEITKSANLFSSSAYRVISFAYARTQNPPVDDEQREIFESDLTYLGFVAINDPPREGVLQSVGEAVSAGVKPVMITGDNIETARSIARELGIKKNNGDLILSGEEAEKVSDSDFLRACVFARVSPEDKLAIVNRYKKLGKVVAMTGDGVNDSLAISAADIGIAMGKTGSDVAKGAAQIVLADDSFNSIILGIREGRGIFQKIRTIVFFYIAVNLAESIVFFGTSFIPRFNLLNSWQHIYIFMTVHSVPPFAIILDYLNRGVMGEKPREGKGIFDRELNGALILFSAVFAVVLLVVYLGTLNGLFPVVAANKAGFVPNFNLFDATNSIGWTQAKARTMLLSVVVVTECVLIVSLRRISKTIPRMLREDTKWITWPLITLPLIAHLILMYVPATQEFLYSTLRANLEIIPLTPSDWLVAILFGVIPIFAFELYKVILQGQSKSL